MTCCLPRWYNLFPIICSNGPFGLPPFKQKRYPSIYQINCDHKRPLILPWICTVNNHTFIGFVKLTRIFNLFFVSLNLLLYILYDIVVEMLSFNKSTICIGVTTCSIPGVWQREIIPALYVPTSNSAADAEGRNPNIAAAILLRAAVTMRLTFSIFFFLYF